MTQDPEHQSEQLLFQEKRIKDQAKEIREQQKAIAEFIKQQQDRKC